LKAKQLTEFLMSISIHFRELNNDKVSQDWEDLISRKEAAEAEAVSVPANPDEVQMDDDFNSPTRTGRGMTIKEALAQNDKDVTLSAIFGVDKRFIEATSGKGFSVPLNIQDEHAVCWLFQAVLDINPEEEDYYPHNAVAGIPFDLWVRLFQSLTPQAMDAVKAKAQKAKYPFDQFRAYLLGVKDVVKFCMDNNSEMISYYDTGPTGTMRQRAIHMYKRLVPEKKEAVV